MRNYRGAGAALIVTIVLGAIASPPLVSAGDTFATFNACVYNKKTGRPIRYASVFVQSLGSANGGGELTGVDGCTSGNMTFNTELFPGDYIEASVRHAGYVFREQYRIPNKLSVKIYHYDFFLDTPRNVEVSEKDPLPPLPYLPR
jgi:hypothetical protein